MSHANITKHFFSRINPQLKIDILRNIASHYGTTEGQILAELTAPEAESLLDYMTEPLRGAVHIKMKAQGLL